MKNNKIRFKNLIFYFRSRIHLIVFLLSVVALIFILFKIINLNVILGISTIIILDFFFQTFVMLSAIYTILFLPTYPIFFIIFKGKKFNFLEKLSKLDKRGRWSIDISNKLHRNLRNFSKKILTKDLLE